MAIRHNIVIRKKGKEVFREEILCSNHFFNKEFYNSLNIEGIIFPETEVKFEDFLIAYFRWLERNPEKIKINLDILGEEKSNLSKAIFFTYFSSPLCVQPFLLIEKMKDFIKPYGKDVISKNNTCLLKPEYKCYITCI